MKKTFFLIFLFDILLFNFSFSETRYVSKTGSDTHPYTSWETAADSIQKAIDASDLWDTVRVGPGTYYETVVMIYGLALIGAGMDSTIIDGSNSTVRDIIHGVDYGSVEGFHIKGRYPGGAYSTGIYNSVGGNTLKYIKNNRISNCNAGAMGEEGTEISNNIIIDNSGGISSGEGLIINNTFINNYDRGINTWFFDMNARILKNIIIGTKWGAIREQFHDSIFIENNLIVDNYGVAIYFYRPSGTFKTVPIRNNTLDGGIFGTIRIEGFSNEIKNNIIFGGSSGISSGNYDSYTAHPQVSYNDIWNNQENYYSGGGSTIDTSLGGNIYSNPMFVDPDSDYHLQKYSPCIDSGDPNIKDPDSSRSDIGCYGGVYGETYTYLDYPPEAPDSLDASFDSISITLTWKPNTEADISHYTVYKDTLYGFTPDSSRIAGTVSKDSSSFKDYDWVYGRDYYYILSAWDLTGNESPYSDELSIEAVDVPETDEIEVEIKKYQLSQNYPNPFNPKTVIVYNLPDIGYQPAEVELTIYNVLGKLVKTLVKERQYPGEHRAVWDGKNDNGNDCASGVYFYRLKVSGIDFVKAKKMVLIR